MSLKEALMRIFRRGPRGDVKVSATPRPNHDLREWMLDTCLKIERELEAKKSRTGEVRVDASSPQ